MAASRVYNPFVKATIEALGPEAWEAILQREFGAIQAIHIDLNIHPTRALLEMYHEYYLYSTQVDDDLILTLREPASPVHPEYPLNQTFLSIKAHGIYHEYPAPF
jgi:hypothetical protein